MTISGGKLHASLKLLVGRELVLEAQCADFVQKRFVGDSQLFGGAGFIPF